MGGGRGRSGKWGLSSNFQNDLSEKMQKLEGEQPGRIKGGSCLVVLKESRVSEVERSGKGEVVGEEARDAMAGVGGLGGCIL